MSYTRPVDLEEDPTAVRRSPGGFTEPLDAPPERAQDGDMSIPELGHQDPRYQTPEPVITVEDDDPSPWDTAEAAMRDEIIMEIDLATEAANRAERWASKLAGVDAGTRSEIAKTVGTLRALAEAIAGRHPAHRSPRGPDSH